ncbi:MAG: hypothetical protein AAF330_04180 [Pseudomonadota bacterium]
MIDHVKTTLIALVLVGWAGLGLLWPALTYGQSTSRDVTVTVVAEPFIGSDVLVYRWKGEVYRSCPIGLRRQIIDSQGVVTTLVALEFGALPPDELGELDYEIRVTMPEHVAEGPAIYQATEVPKCSWMQERWTRGHPYPPVEFVITRAP